MVVNVNIKYWVMAEQSREKNMKEEYKRQHREHAVEYPRYKKEVSSDFQS